MRMCKRSCSARDKCRREYCGNRLGMSLKFMCRYVLIIRFLHLFVQHFLSRKQQHNYMQEVAMRNRLGWVLNAKGGAKPMQHTFVNRCNYDSINIHTISILLMYRGLGFNL